MPPMPPPPRPSAGRPAQTVIVAPSTSRWSRALPGVAFRLGGRVDTHATNLTLEGGAPAVGRWFYRQRMEAVLTRAQRPWVILLDAGCFPAWSGNPGAATLESVAVEAPPTRTTVAGIRAPKADEQTIRPDARLLFRGRRGLDQETGDGAVHSPQAETLIRGFLKASQASLGSSKSLVDLSGEGQTVPPVHVPPETRLGKPGRRRAIPRASPLLPRRRTPRGGLALREPAARRQPGPQLRLGARQSRRALRGRRFRGDAPGQPAAGRLKAGAIG